MSKVAFAIAAHPDDIEFLMAGTLIRLSHVGYEIHYMNVANGCCGSTTIPAKELIEIRREESLNAAKKIGATFHDSLCNDLEIFYDHQTLTKLASVIRQVAPDLVLTHSPVDYMEDHTNTCRLATTATFARGMPNYTTDPPTAPTSKPVAIYHAQPYSNRTPLKDIVAPDTFVDTTDILEEKIEMLSKHVSQKEWLDQSQGLDSYLKTARSLDQEVGAMSNRFRFAEGWRQHLHVGFASSDFDPMSEIDEAYLHRAKPSD